MNAHVQEVFSVVVTRIEDAGTDSFESEFVFIRQDGETHALSMPEIVAMSGKEEEEITEVYNDVVQMIHRHNKNQKRHIVGLVHTAHVGKREGRPHLMVVGLDNTGDSVMAMFPVEDPESGWLGEAQLGTGFSPHLDPWGAAGNPKVEA